MTSTPPVEASLTDNSDREVFSSLFWGDDGYAEACKHVENGITGLKGLIAYLNTRIQAEDVFIKAMKPVKVKESKKDKDKKQDKTFKDVGTCHESMVDLRTETDALVQQHQILHDDLVKNVDNLREVKADLRSRKADYMREAEKAIAANANQHKLIKKAKANYDKLAKMVEDTEIEHNKAEVDPNASRNQADKLADKSAKFRRQCDSAEREYRAALRKGEQLHGDLIKQKTITLQNFEVIESMRICAMREGLKAFVESNYVLVPTLEDFSKNVSVKTSQIDEEADIIAGAQAASTSQELPKALTFEPYVGVNGPISAPPAPESIGICRALFDYNAVDPTEISFPEGAVISVIERDDSGWWIGIFEGNQGIFPSNFVSEMEAN